LLSAAAACCRGPTQDHARMAWLSGIVAAVGKRRSGPVRVDNITLSESLDGSAELAYKAQVFCETINALARW